MSAGTLATDFLRGFPQSLPLNIGIVFPIRLPLLPNPFPFLIHQSSYHPLLTQSAY
jgi:hypothetical protein